MARPPRQISPGQRSRLTQISDPDLHQTLRHLYELEEALDRRLKDLDGRVLKTGSPISGFDERITRVGDPREAQDVVTLAFLRRFVLAATADLVREDAVVATTPGPPPIIPGLTPPSNVAVTSDTPSVAYFISWSPSQGQPPIEYAVFQQGPGPAGPTTLVSDFGVTTARVVPIPTTNGSYGSIVRARNAVATADSQRVSWQVQAGSFVPVPNFPPVPTTGPITVRGRGFERNGQPYPWRGISDFSLLAHAVRGNTGTVIRNFRYYQERKITVPRIILTLHGSFWTAGPFGDLSVTPQQFTNYGTALRNLVIEANNYGLAPELVLIGTLENGVLDSQGLREDLCRRVAGWLDGLDGFFFEVVNERDQMGRLTSPLVELTIDDCYRLGAVWKSHNSRNLLSLGSEGGDNVMHFNRAPADYCTYHIRRDVTPTTMQWVLRHYGLPIAMQSDRPNVSDEPINAGQRDWVSSGYDPDPVNWYAYGAVAQIMQFHTTWHSEEGLFGLLPSAGSSEEACLFGWLLGLSDIPFTLAGDLHGANSGGSTGGPWLNSGTARGILSRSDASTGFSVVLDAPAAWVATGLVAAGWTADLVRNQGKVKVYRVRRTVGASGF